MKNNKVVQNKQEDKNKIDSIKNILHDTLTYISQFCSKLAQSFSDDPLHIEALYRSRWGDQVLITAIGQKYIEFKYLKSGIIECRPKQFFLVDFKPTSIKK